MVTILGAHGEGTNVSTAMSGAWREAEGSQKAHQAPESHGPCFRVSQDEACSYLCPFSHNPQPFLSFPSLHLMPMSNVPPKSPFMQTI